MQDTATKLAQDLAALLDAIEREHARHKAECENLQTAVDACQARITKLKEEFKKEL